MSEETIDEDKITVLYDRAAKKAAAAKQQYHELTTLCNQLAGISKNKDGKLPVSALTKEEMNPQLRHFIYKECMTAAKRHNLS